MEGGIAQGNLESPEGFLPSARLEWSPGKDCDYGLANLLEEVWHRHVVGRVVARQRTKIKTRGVVPNVTRNVGVLAVREDPTVEIAL